MKPQRSDFPASEQEFIRRQVVSQLLQARLRATCGLAQTATPLLLATPTGDRPPLQPLPETGDRSVIEPSQT
ncbi:MAG: hypothetical protein P3X23_009470 [Thermosynechococcus sp. Uc]|uniref:hypothetical protein n=1 Tax=Thermosynechococcus sp. Uc TaxID=3034853 RepID=UPI0019EC06FE|nr:hypothetical protein [Thermosynechococcus sp. Uc]MDM7327326.1 hypothetical protein [Thermosynechococcus sp. Uc]HIK25479.1 hypothetical protein [Thermosynechococcus sp. M46_R2017_013]